MTADPTSNETADLSAQYNALHQQAIVGLLERSLIELRGKDCVSFLHNLCTNDIRKLEPGQACEAFFTDVRGKILCHATVHCEAERMVIETSAHHAEVLMPHLDKYLIREDVELVDRSAAWQSFLIAGPSTESVLAKLGFQVPTTMLHHTVGDLDGAEVQVCRVPFSTAPGFVVRVNRAATDLGAQAQQHGATLASSELLELARIEAAYPRSGQDITDANLPQEVNRDSQAISFTKGCYLGQETVARIDALGHVNKYLVQLRFEAPEVPPVGTELMHDEKVVGQVTSASFSPQLNASLALGYVRREIVEGKTKMSSVCGAAHFHS